MHRVGEQIPFRVSDSEPHVRRGEKRMVAPARLLQRTVHHALRGGSQSPCKAIETIDEHVTLHSIDRHATEHSKARARFLAPVNEGRARPPASRLANAGSL